MAAASAMELTYLVMTAADCADYNARYPHDIVSLNQLLQVRSRDNSQDICVGFIRRDAGGDLVCDALTYRQLYDKVCDLAAKLVITHAIKPRTHDAPSRMRIGLLCPSSETFLIHVLALIRLGWSVLLIAPQNTSKDIVELCERSEVSTLLYHASMARLAASAAALSNDKLVHVECLNSAQPSLTAEGRNTARSQLQPTQEFETECIIFHSSGSSGSPKPIPQKHKVWTKASCCKPTAPSFTTTPLFHGGISDLLRAMMSTSTLYMYPSDLPITADNLLHSFEILPTSARSFLSVPYILELLSDSAQGMRVLADLDLVSTGGAPLPTEIGNKLCAEGVKLVSRYGSSECGFLMTSFRFFGSDRDWSYLRTSAGKDRLLFEKAADESFELVVPEDWPTRSKSNRDDGCFATSDLFRPHPSTPDAWLLCGRSDDVLLMANGEKASPAPIEAALKRNSLIADAVVFGSDRSALGALIVPTQENITVKDLQSTLHEANTAVPTFAQLPPELLVVLQTSDTFPKSSKGSLQRGRAYELFKDVIDKAYRVYEATDAPNGHIAIRSHGEISDFITEKVEEILGRKPILPQADLFNEGLNSLQALRLRNLLQKTVNGIDRLPTNVVYECGSIDKLATYVTQSIEGTRPVSNQDTDLELMSTLLADTNLARIFHQNLHESPAADKMKPSILLTGGTGSLGAHLTCQLLQRRPGHRLVCLVRAQDAQQARQRVLDNLDRNGLDLSSSQLSRLEAVPAQLDNPNLGLSASQYNDLTSTVELIIHAAWSVHFAAGLQAFVPHLHGLANLVSLINQPSSVAGSRFLFCSSTASILRRHGRLPEEISDQPEDAAKMGYARSKFLAEAMCATFWRGQMKDRIGVLRLGQLSGDTRCGIWKAEEGWPLLVSTADAVQCLPDLKESLSWLPVDATAAAILDVADAPAALESSSCPVYNVVSKHDDTTWSQALTWLKAADLDFEIVPPQIWLQRLQTLREGGNDHPCLKMLDVWQMNYGSQNQDAAPITFDTQHVSQYTGHPNTPITSDYIAKLVAHWRDISLLS